MFSIIPQSIRILLALCILLLTFSSKSTAGESLYQRRTARPLNLLEAARFGPQSGNFRYDQRMVNASRIAQARAEGHSTSRCWRYVKQALLAAGVVDSYPKSAYAKQAAQELPASYGFKKLRTRNPYAAPIGAVVVYGGRDAGHVEIRTAQGFVSDFRSPKAYTKRPVIGIFIKPNV